MDKGLYNRLEGLQKHLGNFAMSLTLNKEDAEDLMQETNLKVLDNHDKYVDNTNFKGWVFTIMRNIFINNYRRAARSKTLIDTTDGQRTWTTVGVGTNVIEASWEALYDAYRWGLTKHN